MSSPLSRTGSVTPGEKVSIKLGAPPSGVTKGTTSETVVTIEDVAPLGSTTVSFGSGSYALSEGSSTTVRVVMSPRSRE